MRAVQYSFRLWVWVAWLCGWMTCGILQTRAAAADWLLDNSPYKARIEVSDDGREAILSNGLIRRVLRLKPNAATVAFDDLRTGQSLLRGVKPEAVVELDGQTFAVGGLVGQPNLAFLRPDWVDRLRSDPQSMSLVGHTVGPIVERFPWKRTRATAPDVKWPPPGVALRLDFRLSDLPALQNLPSDRGRTQLWHDPFDKADPAWKVTASRRDARIRFGQDDQAGAIVAPAGTHCFAERALPPDTRLVETVVDPGTDADTSWGPGLGLVFGQRVIEVNLRPGDRGEHGHFELRDRGAERLLRVARFAASDGGLDTTRTYRLRVRMEGESLIWEVSESDGPTTRWDRLFEAHWDGAVPQFVRVGKTDRQGHASDASATGGELNRCRFVDVSVYGPWDPTKLAASGESSDKDVTVSIHYELYDGLPCYGKWLTIQNGGGESITLNRYSSDLLAAVEHTSEVDELSLGKTPPNMHVETDMAFGGMLASRANRRSFRWLPDPDYHTQVNYEKKTPCLLEVGPDLGPDQRLAPGTTFESFRGWVLPFDSSDRERCGLSVRRMYRTLAPWATENPLMMHLVRSDEAAVRQAIDQCAEVGFEMLILSFGSGFDMENRDPAVLAKARSFSTYARDKGIEIGSYSLLASRSITPQEDVVSPPGEKPVFGNSPCLGSYWGQRYFDRLHEFHQASGFTLLEHDGSYPGDCCASHDHPGHRGLADSRWNQWRQISRFYQWCRGEGIFLNVPDHYFLAGSNKTGMGYREVNWSLPRDQQVIHTRQNIYDGTWQKLPSMGWMFVPLTQYHGGGAAATIEPLDEHIDHYERMLDSNLALGVQACYRGPRLFDTDRVRDVVQRKVAWYKAHREILESDLIHGRRADARDVDWMLHINPQLRERGLLAVFNPLDSKVERTLQVNVYYTGLTGELTLKDSRDQIRRVALNRDNTIPVTVSIPAGGFDYFILEE